MGTTYMKTYVDKLKQKAVANKTLLDPILA